MHASGPFFFDIGEIRSGKRMRFGGFNSVNVQTQHPFAPIHACFLREVVRPDERVPDQ